MEEPQANVAKPFQLDTPMELEHSGSSQIKLGFPSPQKTGENKPYFHCILGKTQLHSMGIPKSVNQLLPEEEVPVILSYKNKKWRVKYQGNHAFKRFDSSWKYFVQDNNLKHSKNCIMFRIQVLDGDIPSELRDRVEGQLLLAETS
ncbi:hypothetical protein MKX01_024537 [Papaver californicum]|nr:hypothetical protein MKX01_024537 [Papaver californicum]